MTDVVRPYRVALIAMMSFVLSSGGSSPASDPPRTQCCLPSVQGQGCAVKTPSACRQGGGIDVGPGTCSPNPCGDATTTTTSTSTTLPVLCGNGTIDAGEQCDPPGSSCGAGALCSADCTCPCDFLDPSVCLHPFPNDYFTVADPTTATARRVHLALAGMPRNASQKPIDPTDYNRNDGFSPGASMVLRVPGVDLGVTGAAPITDVERSLDADAPIVLVNATTLAHHLFWAEIDSNASSEASRAVIIRPAVNLAESTRYIVALRRMKDSGGALIAPNP